MTTLPHSRSALASMLPNGAVGAELGVFTCGFSRELIESGKFDYLHLVDPFEGFIGSGDKDGQNHTAYSGEELKRRAYEFIAEFPGKSNLWPMTSLEFLGIFDDLTLDFVYIDTTHTYPDTIAELEASWRVVKSGGMIAGHDFNLPGGGVQLAVIEFCTEKDIDFTVLTGDGLHSFYFFKP